MIFVISRTSYWDKKPCKEAIKIPVEHWHTRTCKSFKEFDERFGEQEGNWLSKGKNHKIINGNIMRQEDYQDEWCIEINSLDELLSLHEKYGNLIISSSYNSSPTGQPLSIEIYDGYRE